MAYNTKAIKTDVNGNPISQYYNPETDEYEPVEGASGGNKVIIYNEDGTPNNSLNFGEILDKLDQLTGTVIAEQYRQQNEAIRQQNEQDRIDLYNALKDLDVSQYELRLQKLEHDTSVEETVVEEAYGPVIPLPENVVNGQINDIKIEGKTYRNVLEDYISDSNNWEILNGELIDNDFIKATADGSYKAFFLKAGIITLKPSTQYTIFVEVRKNTLVSTLTGIGLTVTHQYQDDSFGVTNRISPGETGIFKFLVTTKSDLTNTLPLRMFINSAATSGEIEFRVMLLEGDYTNENISYIRGTKSTLGAIRLKSVNEDETKESTLYILGRDEEGNILELRSLPNGTKDEINVSERKLIKRIEVKANVSSGTVINYTDMAEGGTYFAWNENGETETGTKGDTLGIDAITLIYQLVQPIEIPIEVFGSLQSYKNGTVYVDAIIPRVDFYTSEGIVLEEDEPAIKEIDKLYLVNKENGYLTELDTSKAFIFPDGKGFTHPDLYNDALVDWDYIPDVESTNPAISMALPTNLKASINSSLGGIRDLSEKISNLNIRVTAIQKDDISELNEKILEVEEDLNEHINVFNNHIADYNQHEEVFNDYKENLIRNRILSNEVKYIAHRGISAIAPENTLPAFEKAGELGFWGAECDVLVSADGVWVLHHDDTVDRMTNGTGNVSDFTLAQLKALTIDAGNNIALYPNLKIPTLEEYLVVCRKWNLIPVVEIKAATYTSDNYDTLISILKKAGLESKAIIISFDQNVLTEIRDRSKYIQLQLVSSSFSNDLIDFAKALGNTMLDLNYDIITQSIIEECHTNDIMVNAWTVNDYNTAKTLRNYGVDFITTDFIID